MQSESGINFPVTACKSDHAINPTPEQAVHANQALPLTKKNHRELEIYKVTTPKGCTIAGLNQMEHEGFSSAKIKCRVRLYGVWAHYFTFWNFKVIIAGMRIYLDTCSLQRPLDSQTQTRIRLESEAIIGVLGECEAGRLELVSSEPMELEIEQNPLALRREHATAILEKANIFIALDPTIEQRAAVFVTMGIKPLDSLHLAAAEAANCDYFCTCDDRFLRRAKQLSGLRIKAVSPLELVQELGL